MHGNMLHNMHTQCANNRFNRWYVFSAKILPRDVTQSAVLLRQVVCLSVRLSVSDDIEVSWSHRSEFFEKNFTVS